MAALRRCLFWSGIAAFVGCATAVPPPPALPPGPPAAVVPPHAPHAPPAPAPAAQDPAPVDPSIAGRAAIDRFTLAAADLPPAVSVGGEPRCESAQSLSFFADPTMFGALPAPAARASQTFLADGQPVATLLFLAYPGPVPRQVRQFLPALLWGDEHMPSPDHPEEVIAHDEVLIVVCTPFQDPGIEWVKDRLRSRFGARLARACPDLRPVLAKVMATRDRSGPAKAYVQLVLDGSKALDGCSVGQYILGGFAMGQRDYGRAERSFRSALELHERGELLPGNEASVWAVTDGLGLALALQGKHRDALVAFEKARGIALEIDDPQVRAKAHYNVASTEAELALWDRSARSLEAAIAADPAIKEQARRDRVFAKVKSRSEFKGVLE